MSDGKRVSNQAWSPALDASAILRTFEQRKRYNQAKAIPLNPVSQDLQAEAIQIPVLLSATVHNGDVFLIDHENYDPHRGRIS